MSSDTPVIGSAETIMKPSFSSMTAKSSPALGGVFTRAEPAPVILRTVDLRTLIGILPVPSFADSRVNTAGLTWPRCAFLPVF